MNSETSLARNCLFGNIALLLRSPVLLLIGRNGG
jgi:hypothetical protein